MVCWKCLLKMEQIPGLKVEVIACPSCAQDEGPASAQARADRFFALVAAGTSGSPVGTEYSGIVEDARRIMREIERRVESGTLFENGGS
ncbi:MAG: hypothetical protein ABFE13_11470 [Phycisphaerales bacterium]